MSVAATNTSEETLPVRTRIQKLIRQGFPVYPQVLTELADKISPDEAEDARRANRRDLLLLAASIAAGALIQFIMYRVPSNPFNYPALLYDLYDAGTLLIILLLVSVFRIHFAGRLLLPLAALGSQYQHPSTSWDFSFFAFFLFLGLALAYIIGALMDFGASTVPERRGIRLRRWTLLGTGLTYLWLISFTIQELGGYFPILSILAAFLCCIWGWSPGQWLEKRAGLSKTDSETLRLAATKRWALFAWGRALAILIGLLPCILFLNGLELKKMLTPKNGAVRTTGNGEEQVWFWVHKGEFLTKQDLKREKFYVFLDSSIAKKKLNSIWEADSALRGTIYDSENYDELEERYRQLQEALKPYRLVTQEQFDTALAQARTNEDQLELYHLARDPIKAKGPLATVPAIFSVEDQLWAGTNRLVPLSQSDILQYTAHNEIWQWLLLGFGLMGFTFLWRRGGDSIIARWLGIWLMGVGIVGSYRYARLFLPALGFDLWHRSLVHPSGNLLLSVIVLLDLITLSVAFLFFCFVPLAALWTHSCWPVTKASSRSRRWVPSLPLWVRIALVSLLMSVSFYGSLLGVSAALPSVDPVRAELTSSLVAIVAFVCSAFFVGYRLWRRRQQSVRYLDWLPGILLLAVQTVVVTAITINESSKVAVAFKLSGLILGIALIILLMLLIFREDLFHVSAARDFSFVIVFMVLPALFAWSEDLSKDYLFDLTQGAVVSQRGAGILGVVLAIALLPPIRRAMEKGILHLSAPRFRRIQRCIEEALETLVESNGDPLTRIGEVLQQCGLKRFAFYRRTGNNAFELLIHLEHEAAAEVEMSPPLRRFLSLQQDFIDLERIAIEWRFFFVQFELHRLRSQFGGRYLLPICLSTSLRGFLVVPGSTRENQQRVVGSPLIGGLSTLGIAAAHLSADITSGAIPGQPIETVAPQNLEA